MLTGWAEVGGRRYYFGSDGVMRTDWADIDGGTYYFGKNGACFRGNSYLIDGMVYTFDDSGRLTGKSSSGI